VSSIADEIEAGGGTDDAVLAPWCNDEFDTVPDCDCPSEHWHFGRAGVCLEMHLEPDGSAHCAIYGGDWETETVLHGVTDIEALRPLAFQWADDTFRAVESEAGDA
jgi:hypothetical protein